ncbi:hypothetical protein ACFL96_18655 [Thermoproteota archaeon]
MANNVLKGMYNKAKTAVTNPIRTAKIVAETGLKLGGAPAGAVVACAEGNTLKENILNAPEALYNFLNSPVEIAEFVKLYDKAKEYTAPAVESLEKAGSGYSKMWESLGDFEIREALGNGWGALTNGTDAVAGAYDSIGPAKELSDCVLGSGIFENLVNAVHNSWDRPVHMAAYILVPAVTGYIVGKGLQTSRENKENENKAE